ncbi:MAG: hypothetical protein RL026_2475 [Pseudomonadota bacterium]
MNRLMARTFLGLTCLYATAHAQVPPVAVADQRPLLESADPRLAANKRLVFDMMRTVLNAGRADLVDRFVTAGYIQHNPNVQSGRAALADYIRRTRPARAIPEQVTFPVISIVAEGDLVSVATVSYEDDPEKPGQKYVTTHFDLFRIENGLIAEHWDNVGRSTSNATKDPNVSNRP